MFISEAFAQTAGAASSPIGDMMQFLPFGLIIVVFYFLMWRPQAKKAKQHKEMVSQLRRGDKVVLNSGFYGTISRVVDEQVVLVEIAENVKVRVARAAVSEVQAKTEPVPAAAKDAAPAETAENDKK